MSITMMIYLANVAGNISVALFAFIIFWISVYIFICMIYFIDYRKINIPHKKVLTCFSIATILCVAIPNKKTIYLMAATSIAEDVYKNPQVINRMDKVIKIIDAKLDEEIASMKKGK
jgi:hypothetical protein